MTITRLDLQTLTLQDALDLAILVEEEAEERYREFVDQLEVHHTPEAAEFFRFMAGNEAKHGRELGERRKALFGDAPARVTRAMLWDVEAPEYDQARAFMTPRAAMEAALACEEKAHAFFVEVLPRVNDPEVRALFAELREEEVEHQRLVRDQLDRLPPDAGPSSEDFEDEPVAQ
jgi:erythrin-vacuolar iron transport family protein